MAEPTPAAKPKLIELRYPGRCRDCSTQLSPGDQAIHVRAEKAVVCLSCAGDLPAGPAKSQPPITSAPPITSEPGASALRQYERKRKVREEHATAAFGSLGKLATKVLPEPQNQKNWKTGAQGEREAAARLAKLLKGTNVLVLHDRKVPGSVANIDHIAVGPGGITVIDTKKWSGKVRAKKSGFGKNATEQLVVNGRDRTKAIDGILGQVAKVESALQGLEPSLEIEVLGAMYWWNYDGLPLLGEVCVNGVLVDAGKKIAKLAKRPGDLDEKQMQSIYQHLALALPAA